MQQLLQRFEANATAIMEIIKTHILSEAITADDMIRESRNKVQGPIHFIKCDFLEHFMQMSGSYACLSVSLLRL